MASSLCAETATLAGFAFLKPATFLVGSAGAESATTSSRRATQYLANLAGMNRGKIKCRLVKTWTFGKWCEGVTDSACFSVTPVFDDINQRIKTTVRVLLRLR